MIKLSLLGLFFTTFFVSSCDFGARRVNGNGKVVNQNRTIAGAQSVSVIGSIDVEIKKGPTDATVIADENLQEYILLDKRQEGITIRVREGFSIRSDNDVKVIITTPILEEIKTVGSSDIVCLDRFETSDKVKLVSSGSGDVEGEFKTPEIAVSIAGSGTAKLKGETRDIVVKIAGSGNFEGAGLKAETAEFSISGSGDASIFASVSIKATINGSGSLKYSGNPAISSKVRGSGAIIKVP